MLQNSLRLGLREAGLKDALPWIKPHNIIGIDPVFNADRLWNQEEEIDTVVVKARVHLYRVAVFAFFTMSLPEFDRCQFRGIDRYKPLLYLYGYFWDRNTLTRASLSRLQAHLESSNLTLLNSRRVLRKARCHLFDGTRAYLLGRFEFPGVQRSLASLLSDKYVPHSHEVKAMPSVEKCVQVHTRCGILSVLDCTVIHKAIRPQPPSKDLFLLRGRIKFYFVIADHCIAFFPFDGS